jgi:PPM family protein phosphatase
MNPRVWCQTDVGLRRSNNQDFFLHDEALGVYIVADGMGGHKGGEVASRMAAETVMEHIRATLGSSRSRRIKARVLLTEAYEEASRKVFAKSREDNGQLEGMGTTLVVVLAYDGVLYIGNVGDSRCYLYSDGRLWQITEDHSLMNEQLRAGMIAEADIPRFSGKNVITRSVGFESDVQVDIVEREIRKGDIYLVCSDGLSGLVSDQRIAEICRTTPLEGVVGVCINEAKRNGGDDNVTVMLIGA